MSTPNGVIISTKDSLNYITKLHIAIDVIPEYTTIDITPETSPTTRIFQQNSPTKSPTAKIIDFFSKFF